MVDTDPRVVESAAPVSVLGLCAGEIVSEFLDAFRKGIGITLRWGPEGSVLHERARRMLVEIKSPEEGKKSIVDKSPSFGRGSTEFLSSQEFLIDFYICPRKSYTPVLIEYAAVRKDGLKQIYARIERYDLRKVTKDLFIPNALKQELSLPVDGNPVMFHLSEMSVTRALAEDMPSERFVLSFPPGTYVEDKVGRMTYLVGDERLRFRQLDGVLFNVELEKSR